MKLVFEYDDYPRGKEDLLKLLDGFKEDYPNFKVNMFAIPGEMTRHDYREIWRREEWIRLYPHGMIHDRGECRVSPRPTTIALMEELKDDSRWGNVFKAPWNGYCSDFLWMLHDVGMHPAVTNLVNFPMPMPREWKIWSHRCARQAKVCSGRGIRRGDYVVAHPVYPTKQRAGSRRSEISPRNVRWWKRAWREETEWEFCEDRLTPALLKLHLGCGSHVFDGWVNLDPRSALHPDIRDWDYSRLIPLSDNKADICLTSHTFNYIEDSFYEEALLDIWRVLRPGGILRMQEDRTDSGYIWRRPGQEARGTGEIKSLPTKERIWQALENVGFKVYTSTPGKTKSPHKDVIQGDSRERRYRLGHKFIVEAQKDENINLSKVRMTDRRATVDGRYTLEKGSE